MFFNVKCLSDFCSRIIILLHHLANKASQLEKIHPHLFSKTVDFTPCWDLSIFLSFFLQMYFSHSLIQRSLRCSRTCHEIPGIVLYWRFCLSATQATQSINTQQGLSRPSPLLWKFTKSRASKKESAPTTERRLRSARFSTRVTSVKSVSRISIAHFKAFN